MGITRFVIRQATLQDGPAVEQLWTDLMMEAAGIDRRFEPADDARRRWQADYPEWLQDSTHTILVAERDRATAGFVSARLWGAAPIFKPVVEVFVEFLFVMGSYRREGIGTALVREVTLWGAGLGAERLRMGTLARDEDARVFWQKCGAEPFGVEMTIPIREGSSKSTGGPMGFSGNTP